MGAHVEDNGIVRQYLLDPVARPLGASLRAVTESPLLRYGLLAVSLGQTALLVSVLWIDTSYWPWWMFAITGAISLLSSLNARIARHHGGPGWNARYETVAAAVQTAGVLTSILASLHVFHVSPWSALAVVAAVGTILVTPYAAARATAIVQWGRWSGPDELRLGASLYCLALSPWHPAAAAIGLGDGVSLATALALGLPLAAHVITFRRALPGHRHTLDALSMLAGVAAPAAFLAAAAPLDLPTATARPILFAWTLVPACACAAARAAASADPAVDAVRADPSMAAPALLFAFRALGDVPEPTQLAVVHAMALLVAGPTVLALSRRVQ